MDHALHSARFASSAIVVAVVCLGWSCSATGGGPAPVIIAAADPHTVELYGRHCAACHGDEGRGDGPLATYLWPPPRAFAGARFSLVSTDNGMPTNDDLVSTLTRGLPGSAMPSFAWMPADDRRGLARYVRELAVAVRAADLAVDAVATGRPITDVEARVAAQAEFAPGVVIEPVAVAAGEAALARGREIYTRDCAACHGADGRGRPMARDWCERFDLHWARDFTSGILKGGADAAALQHRIVAGMPASGMPPTVLADADLAAVVAFVRSLIPEGASDRLRLARREIVAARSTGELPEDVDDPRWQRADRVALSPLQWHGQAVFEAEVAALHDGSDVAVLVRWPDATRDGSPLGSLLPDGVALQWSADPDPPAIAMGSREHAVDIWQWRAYDAAAAAGLVDLIDAPSDATGRRPGTDAGQAANLETASRSQARSSRATGRESAAAFASAGEPLAVTQQWRDGEWRVLFRRPLAPAQAGPLRLRPGTRLHLALAVWNGGGGDSGPRKSISAWQAMVLAP